MADEYYVKTKEAGDDEWEYMTEGYPAKKKVFTKGEAINAVAQARRDYFEVTYEKAEKKNPSEDPKNFIACPDCGKKVYDLVGHRKNECPKNPYAVVKATVVAMVHRDAAVAASTVLKKTGEVIQRLNAFRDHPLVNSTNITPPWSPRTYFPIAEKTAPSGVFFVISYLDPQHARSSDNYWKSPPFKEISDCVTRARQLGVEDYYIYTFEDGIFMGAMNIKAKPAESKFGRTAQEIMKQERVDPNVEALGNLQISALQDEQEAIDLYSQMADLARSAGKIEDAEKFEGIAQDEKRHHAILSAMKNGQ